ncbi:MAG: AMP-binding protein [Granulosicoccus sp.]
MQSSDFLMDSPATVQALIDRRAEELAGREFLIDPDHGRSLSYRQLQQEVRAVADYLASQGLQPGSSVAYAMHNGRCCAVSILGIMYGGYRAVAINLVAGRDVVAYVLLHSETQLVLTQRAHLPLINAAVHSNTTASNLAEIPVHCVDDHVLDDWVSRFPAPGCRDMAAHSDALLMYTSGTTGKPKGVVLSHSNIIAGGHNVALGHLLSTVDRALCVLPLYHIHGLCVTLSGPLVSGGSVVLPGKFSTSAFWQLVDQNRCTWFSVVPTQIAYLLRDASSTTPGATAPDQSSAVAPPARPHLRFGRSASAPLSADVHAAFESQFSVPLIETMGLTETAAQILTNPLPPGIRKLGSPGLPVGDEVIVVDSQLKPVDAGTEGELLVRGPNVMSRYYRNEAATQETLLDDGWLRTGDLGRKDENGYMFVTGRLKELIIKGGENIAPREIDDALYQHADVVEAAAFACTCEDFGQRVEAAVALRQDSALGEADLLALCVERVGKFKCPDRIHFLAELPKGPSGKIQRQKLASLLGG